MATYVSQMSTFLTTMITYMQNPANWIVDGVPKITDFSPGSVAYTTFAAVAVAIDMQGYATWSAKQAAYISTATGSDLDNKAADYGIIRKAAVAASGTFNLTKNVASSQNIDIPVGSLISTLPDSNGNVVTFATTVDATLVAGQTSVNVQATCQTAGSSGNIAANTSLVISSATPGIDGANLQADIDNGVDTESDTSLRARTMAAFTSLAAGTLAWYQNIALSIAGVAADNVVSQNRGAGTVDIFLTGPNNSVPSETVQAAVQTAINNGRLITDDAQAQLPGVLPITATVLITVLPGYDPDTVCTAVQTAIIAAIDAIGEGGGELGLIYPAILTTAAMGVSGAANPTTTFEAVTVLPTQLPQGTTTSITVNHT